MNCAPIDAIPGKWLSFKPIRFGEMNSSFLLSDSLIFYIRAFEFTEFESKNERKTLETNCYFFNLTIGRRNENRESYSFHRRIEIANGAAEAKQMSSCAQEANVCKCKVQMAK